MAATRKKSHRGKKSSTKRRAKRASRKGKMPAGLAAYWAGKKAKASKPKRHKSRARKSRKSRMKVKRTRARRSRRRGPHPKGTPHRQNAHDWNPGLIVRANPRRRRHSRRKAGAVHHKRRRSRRRVGANPGSMTLLGGLTHITDNLKATFMRGGVKGIAGAVAGAAGAVFLGTLAARTTGPLVAGIMPSLASNAMVARLLAAANFYGAAWAAAKFTPGLSAQTRRAVLTGGTAAALVELIKPGTVRTLLAKLPVVGTVFGSTLAGLEEGVGSYVASALQDYVALSGNGNTDRYDDGTVSDYVRLNDYVELAHDETGIPGMATY